MGQSKCVASNVAKGFTQLQHTNDECVAKNITYYYKLDCKYCLRKPMTCDDICNVFVLCRKICDTFFKMSQKFAASETR